MWNKSPHRRFFGAFRMFKTKPKRKKWKSGNDEAEIMMDSPRKGTWQDFAKDKCKQDLPNPQ